MQRKWKSIQPAPLRDFELTHQESMHLIPTRFSSGLGIFLVNDDYGSNDIDIDTDRDSS